MVLVGLRWYQTELTEVTHTKKCSNCIVVFLKTDFTEVTHTKKCSDCIMTAQMAVPWPGIEPGGAWFWNPRMPRSTTTPRDMGCCCCGCCPSGTVFIKPWTGGFRCFSVVFGVFCLPRTEESEVITFVRGRFVIAHSAQISPFNDCRPFNDKKKHLEHIFCCLFS